MRRWRDIPVEKRRREHFYPSHCPWPECSQHTIGEGECFSYCRSGTYQRKGDTRRVQRFRCATCKRTFSQQTFSCTYYLKRPELLVPIFASLNGCSAHRQIARGLGCAPATVTGQSQRLGRHAMLLQAVLLGQADTTDEPIVVDHFESFAYSQWDRVAVATPVGKDTGFVYGLEPAPHKRAGKVSSYQQKKREKKGVPPPRPGEILRSTRRVLDLLAARAPIKKGKKITIVSDGHESYVNALSTCPNAWRFEHRVHPNPERGPKGAPRSAEARRRDQAMFAVDQLHGLWRHSSANHKRETLAFAKRENALVERAYVFSIWRNLVKGRSERKGDPTTPAMLRGLTEAPWSWQKVLSQRLFPSRVATPPGMMTIYRRQRVTPALGHNATHALKRAF